MAQRAGKAGVLFGFALAHVALLGVVYPLVLRVPASAVQLFYDFASSVAAGKLPYRDFPLEYPPFAVPFFFLPRLAGVTISQYYFWYQLEVLMADLIGLWIVHAAARERTEATWFPLAGYTLAVVAVGPIITWQFDIFPAVLTLAAAYCFWRDRTTRGWMLLALGALTKLYPLITAPLWLLRRERSEQVSATRRGIAIMAATTAVVLLPWVVAPLSLLKFFQYHARRGIQLESSYASLILLADKLGLTIAGVGHSFGSFNVTGQAADLFAPVSTVALLAGVVLTFMFLARRRGSASAPQDASWEWVSSALLLLLTVVLSTSKVLSPQYIIWLVPWIPGVPAESRRVIWPLFAGVGVLTYYIFPSHYAELIHGATGVELVLVVRNLLLVGLAAASAQAVRRAAETSLH